MKPEITFDDFAKLDIRAGIILSAETVPKSDKLLKMQVDFGDLGQRQILSGIAKHFEPSSLVGKQVVAIVNLAPRKMMGYESHGMLLASHDNEKFGLISVDCQVAPGSEVG